MNNIVEDEMFQPGNMATVLAAFAVAALAPLLAGERPSITFQNRSGDDAVVRLAGPTSTLVTVVDSTSRTVDLAGGTYRMFVRYGSAGKYRYTKGKSFTVYEGSDGVDRITITLHKVVGGNYSTSPSSAAEFAAAR